MTARDTLKNFTLRDIPDLDVAVLGALELLAEVDLPTIPTKFQRPLVIGSGNAEYTGRIIFKESDAVFANESSYQDTLKRLTNIDGAVVISASGSKHSIEIVKYLKEQQLPTVLLTNNPDAAAAEYLEKENIIVFPKNREPYTYNTSTYLGMILASEGGDPKVVSSYIQSHFSRDLIPGFSSRTAFTFILPGEVSELRGMLRTKFDELFGPKLVGRFFTLEEVKHAKIVVPDPEEIFLNFTYTSLGKDSELRLSLPSGYFGAMAATYYIIGLIQNAKPPHFRTNIARYCLEASAVFGQDIHPIVE